MPDEEEAEAGWEEAVVEALRGRLRNFREHDSGGITIGGRRAWFLFASHEMEQPLDILVYLAKGERHLFVITCTCLGGEMPKHRATFDRMARSFTFPP